MSSKVYELSSEQREKLHLAAVFANNSTCICSRSQMIYVVITVSPRNLKTVDPGNKP